MAAQAPSTAALDLSTANAGGQAATLNLPPLLHAAGRYFATPDGKPVYVAGSHTWTNVQDIGGTPFDFSSYLGVLGSENANFIRGWTWESLIAGGIAHGSTPNLPYERNGNGKFDLTKFDQSYFDNLRAHAQAAGAQGMYVSIMLFDGWSVNTNGSANNPWMSHPYNAANNVNGIDGDPGRTGQGASTQTLSDPRMLALQQAYVAKAIDTVGDLSNVLFEVANETAGTGAAMAWQNAIVDFVHQYEASKGGMLHPVGITAPWPATEGFVNPALLASHADWISPSGAQGAYRSNPPEAPGSKVVLLDTDHVYGVGGDANWVWQGFMKGYNILYMDDLSGTGVKGTLQVNLDAAQVADEQSARLAIAETRKVSTMLDLLKVKPSSSLSSTGYALADPGSGQYVVYAPGGKFTVDLSGASGRNLDASWLDVASGQVTTSTTVPGGSGSQVFSSPFGSSVLVLTPQVLVMTPPAVPAPTPAPATPATLVLHLSEDAYQGDAQFTVSVDGQTLGPAQSVTAQHAARGSQAFTFSGEFAPGPHQVSVSFINDLWNPGVGDRNLYVEGITLNGAAAVVPETPLYANGRSDFTVQAPAMGSLVLRLSEDAYQGDAQFTVSVDGKTLGPAQSVTALHGAGASQAFSFAGTFAPGAHQVSVSFVNDKWDPGLGDRNLYVDGVTLNGTAAPGAAAALYSAGHSDFTVTAPGLAAVPTPTPTPAPVPVPITADTLVLRLSEDAYAGDAQFTATLDGKTLGPAQAVTALHGTGAGQAFTFAGSFGPGAHDLAVMFTNDLWNPGVGDRNLYVQGASLNGVTSASPGGFVSGDTNHPLHIVIGQS